MDTLLDTGPLVSVLASAEPSHARCRTALEQLGGDLFTVWPVISEAMFILARHREGQAIQQECWRLILDNAFVVMDIDANARARAAALMQKYADTPMSLADASLVALGEQIDTRRVFTLDGDFRVYRFRDKRPFEVIPN